jgi:hypothetical protein
MSVTKGLFDFNSVEVRLSCLLLVVTSSIAIFFCSGRLGNADAADQLAAAYVFAATGQIGAELPPGGFRGSEVIDGELRKLPKRYFWQSPNGLYYQTHDLGNPVLMTPLAILGLAASSVPAEQQIETPPLFIKVLASILSSLQGPLVSLAIYGCLRLYVSSIQAFLYSAIFLLTNFFLAHTRMPWDVTGAGLFGSIAFLATLSFVRSADHATTKIAIAGAACGLTAAFRYSFAPFMILMVGLCLLPYRDRITKNAILAFGVCLILFLLPSFAYNYIRMGNPLHPATVIPVYPTRPELSWRLPGNLFRLLFSFNKGLFIYCPFLLFALWQRTPEMRLIRNGVVIATLAYAGVLAATRTWAAGISWGPRYLVPVLPMLYFLAVVNVVGLRTRLRGFAHLMMLTAFLINLPSFISNHLLSVSEYPPALDESLNFPCPQIAGWKGVVEGIRNIDESTDIRLTNTSAPQSTPTASRAFPDLLLCHIARHSRIGSVLALGLFTLLSVVCIFCFMTATKISHSENDGLNCSV